MQDPLIEVSLRSTCNYDSDIHILESSGCEHVNGIKFASPFNNLNYFHVCKPGMPPCIAHDLFEGVIAYDLVIIIQKFVSKKWFTLKCFNHIVRSFSYSHEDRISKALVVRNWNKLSRNACQIWCLLHLLPLLIGDQIQDYSDPRWCMVLKLHQIVEIICAPALNAVDISCLNIYIREYIGLRCSVFPAVPLRPKYHYLCHYPRMILQFGPLIRTWTLCFGSKHLYFKRVFKSYGNFINITKTLANHHQMLQSYLMEIGLFKKELELFVELVAVEYPPKIISCLSLCSFDVKKCFFYKKVSYKGTLYLINNYVVLEKRGCDFVVGKVVCIFKCNEVVYFLLNTFVGHLIPHLNIYCLKSSVISKNTVVRIYDLYDSYPLHCYQIQDMNCVCLKHYIR